MNALDVVLAMVFVAAVVGGLRVGFVARVVTWIGVVIGLLAASFTVPLVLGLLATEAASFRFVAGLAVLAFTVTLSTAAFQGVAVSLRPGVATSPLSRLDRVLGALAGGAMVIGIAWFLLPAAADTPGLVASQARGSGTLELVERFAPPPPAASARLRGLIASSGFPEVWGDLRSGTESGPPPEQVSVDPGVVARATEATVHVESRGCGRRFDGSGVTIEGGLVITNAHVVAGADEVVVRRPDGAAARASVMQFDAARDLALLSVDGLGQAALPLAEMPTGSDGIVIGYPGGQREPRVAPVRLDDRRRATGRDIYGEAETERDVLFLSAALRQGDSGSPVVDRDGHVTGIVFAISPDEPTSAFALDLPEIEALLEAPRQERDTGRCIG